jgi:phage/conjugal plasmid C-4 type zinc finger TraR family protein
MDDAEHAKAHEDFLHAAKIKAMRAEMAARASSPQVTECEACGYPIPAERLAAQPGCTMCVNCKDQQERGQSCLSVD